MYPKTAIAKLFPHAKCSGEPVEAAKITEASAPKVLMAKDAGIALCEEAKDKLAYVVEVEGGGFLVVGAKSAFLVTADSIDQKQLTEDTGKTDSSGVGFDDDAVKTAFSGKAATSDAFFKAVQAGMKNGGGKTTTHEGEAGEAIIDFLDESGTVIARHITGKDGSATRYLLPEAEISENVLANAVKAQLQKALKGESADEIKECIRKALQTVDKIAGGKVKMAEATEIAEAVKSKKDDKKAKADDADDKEDDKDEEDDEDKDEEGDDQDDDEDDEDMEEAIRCAAATVLCEAGRLDLDTTAVETAITEGDYAAAISALEGVALAVEVDVAEVTEGLRARAHKRGRRPGARKGLRGRAPMPKPKMQVGPGVAGKKIAEGSAQTSANGTVPGQATAEVTVTVSSIPEGQASGVADLVRMAGGQATADGESIVGLFTVAERADEFMSTLKDRIPGASASRSGKTETARESVQEWIGRVRSMPVEDFVAHIAETIGTDSDDDFQTRVAALTEAYKLGGKKDMARKITAVNSLVKKKTGKGINLEGVAEDRIKITLPRERLDEFIAVANKLGAPAGAAVNVLPKSVEVILPESIADKIKLVFDGADVAYAAA